MNCRNKFKEALDDDLNVSRALTEVFNFMNEVNKLKNSLNFKQAQEIKKFIFEIDSVLGFIKPLYQDYQKKKNELLKNKTIHSLLEKREKLRKNKNYAAADQIRKQLLKKGLIIEDRPKGFMVKMIYQNL